MKKVIMILGVIVLLGMLRSGLSFGEEKSLIYHAYSREGVYEPVIGETFIEFKDLPQGRASISRKKQVKTGEMNDEFILDKEYSLESWTRVCVEEDTDVTSVRNGNILVVKGRLQGQVIDKEIELGRQALHIYPKYSLTKFVLSDMPKMNFWTMRRDKMEKLPMQAIKKGIKTIVVNGEEVDAIKVYYSITGKLRQKSFNHNYYYRQSDGLFLKKEEPKGRVEDLVSEN